jgi:tRNA (guanine-N7-)-methyltransferase
MKPTPPTLPRFLPSFGRRRMRGLKASEQALFDSLLPQLEIRVQEGADPRQLFPGKEQFYLEIGFGAGEHLLSRALAEPEAGFIGSEVFLNGLGAFLRHVDKARPGNIRLFTSDARLLVEAIPTSALGGIYILFPDPWPKLRHHKRRLISHAFLSELARVIRPGGFLHLATDDVPYLRWMLCHMLEREEFCWQAQTPKDWDAPEGHIPTRYERKAHAQGRRGYFLNYINVKEG